MTATATASDLLTIGEAMEVLRCSRDTIYRYMRADGLPYEQYRGRRLIASGKLQSWRESITVNCQNGQRGGDDEA